MIDYVIDINRNGKISIEFMEEKGILVSKHTLAER